MWKTVSRARETRRSFTISVQGAYHELGPQGTIARVPQALGVALFHQEASSRAMIAPISAESPTIRRGILRQGWAVSASTGTRHHSRRSRGRTVSLNSPSL